MLFLSIVNILGVFPPREITFRPLIDNPTVFVYNICVKNNFRHKISNATHIM